MSIAEKLDSFRHATPACDLVAFGDVDARLILRSASKTRPPQEYLDELCDQAAWGFACQSATGHDISDVMLITPTEARLFVGSAENSDLLVCVSAGPDDADAMRDAAHRLHRQLGEA